MNMNHYSSPERRFDPFEAQATAPQGAWSEQPVHANALEPERDRAPEGGDLDHAVVLGYN